MSDHSDLVGEPCPPDRCRDRTDPRACMCAKAAAALTARAEEIERLTAERKLLAGQREAQTAAMTWLKGAHDGSNAEIARLRAAVTALVEAAGHAGVSLEHAISIIDAHVPKDALGVNAQGDPDVPGGYQEWPLLDEYLHNMRESIAALSRAVEAALRAEAGAPDE